MYKPVVDSNGFPVGQVINLTQNGSGNFDVFGVRVDQAASTRMNHGSSPANGPIFLEIELIDTVGKVVRLKKRVEDLLEESAH